MSDTTSRKPTPAEFLAFFGMFIGFLVFLGGLWMGMSIDPRIDMYARLLCYTTALGGLTSALACRWQLAKRRGERTFYAAVTLSMLALFIGYAFVML